MNLHPHIQQSIRVAALFGFISKNTFNTFLPSLKRSASDRIWKQMKDRSIFEPYYQIRGVNNFLRLTRKGKALATSMGLPTMKPPYLSQIDHDELLASLLLSNEHLFESFWTEGQLKKFPSTIKSFVGLRQMKYPDLLVSSKNSNQKIAIEYERSRKSFKEYQRILLSYAMLSDITSVLFITESMAIKEAIKDTAIKIKYPLDRKPLLFVLSSEVKATPHTFDIEAGRENKNFQWLLKPFEEMH